jgi:hypothetical protein
MPHETDTQARPLVLKAHLKQATIKLSEAIPVEIELVNQGQVTLIVNARFGMGYPDSLDRDLYCEIQFQNNQLYTGYRSHMLDYRRKALADHFFTSLAPGESVSSSFDLQEWYPILDAGVYQIRVVYDPEPYPSIPNVVTEKVISNPLSLTVQANP